MVRLDRFTRAGRARRVAGGAVALLGTTLIVGAVGVLPASAAANGQASPTSVAFGGVPVGSTSGTQTVSFTNTGTSNLFFTGAGVTISAGATDFGIFSSTCTSPLTPTSSCSVQVNFTPTAVGNRTGNLRFIWNAGATTDVPLSGKGLPSPNISFTPNPVTFPPQGVGTTSAAKTVTVKNTGSTSLTIGSITTTGPFSVSSSTGCLTGPIGPGGTCEVAVNFTPTAVGPATGTLVFNDNAPASPQSVTLNGTGTAGPNVALSPASVNFGSWPVSTTSTSAVVTLTNTGNADLHVTSVTLGGTNPADFGIVSTTCGGATVFPNGTCTATVHFIPTAVGARSAVLNFADDAPGSPQGEPLNGTGLAPPAPGFGVSPTSLTFANQQVGTTSAAQTVTVTNTGSSFLHVSSVTFTGTNPGDFGTATNTCGGGGGIAPGNTCTVSVTFTPAAVGSRTANLHFVDDAASSPQDVPLSGTGIAPLAPGFSANPGSVVFGPQGVGTTSPVSNVTITNTGTAPLHVATVTLTGGTPGDFAISSNGCTAAVAPGANCVVGVTFTPTAAGARSTNLHFTDDAASSPQDVPLSGTGTTGPGISISPSSLTFLAQPVGVGSAGQTVTATNTGNAPLHITGLSFGGANPGDFSISGQNCTLGAITPGGNCTATVVFTPGAVGARNATLVFTDDAPASPQSIPLKGTGTNNGPVINLSPNPLTFADQGVGTTGATQFETVTNTGNANLVVTGVSTGGANPGDFPVNGTGTCVFPITLAPGGTCTVGVAFSPSAAGARAATLLFNDNAAASPQAVPMSGNGVLGAAITLTPPSLAFGNQAIGTTSAQKNIVVKNSGGAGSTLGITNVTIGGANPGDYAISADNCVGASLAQNATCTIGITFSPLAVGSRVATLIITDSLNTSPHTAALGGNGIPGPIVSLSPSPANLHFGLQLVGTTSAAQTVTVSNTGVGNLVITAITKAGANPSQFAVTGCTPLPFTVPPGGSCTLSVTFHPTSVGFKSATISLTDNAPGSPQVINVDGTGTNTPPGPTSITFTSQDLTFGVIPHGTTSAPQTVTITNIGANPWQLAGAPALSDTTDYTITGDTCLPGPIAPGGSCDLTITFNPPASGVFPATITLNSNAVSSPDTINLFGKAT